MLDNNLHNLMTQLTQESKSLWRIKEQYMADAEGSESAKAFWEKLVSDKESHIEELKALVKQHLGA